MKKFMLPFLLLALIAGVSSCVKDKFDAPPAFGEDPDIVVNFSIDSLKARYATAPVQIKEDLVISAVVVADDKSGNLYKQVIIQDSTGGIALLVDGSYLYGDMPIGRRIFIKLKDLWVGNYHGVHQLGGYIQQDGSVGGITGGRVNDYILKGKWGIPVEPKAVKINQLNASYINTLIALDGVEFATADAGKPFADAFNLQSLSRTVKDCNGGNVVAYTSGYSTFANKLTPSGNGRMIAIYSVYNATSQLIIRDPSDLTMDTTRCGGSVVSNGNGLLGVSTSYSGADVTLPANKIIRGIVISDKDHGNIDPKNVVIQDSTGGIVVRFSGTHNFALNDELQIDVSGQTLTSYNGLIEIINVPLANATVVGTGTITPRVATVQQVLANSTAWESTLITVVNATISGTGTTYSGSKTLTDITGNMTLYTRTQATFSGANFPTGNVSVTGFLSDFNGVQFQLRDTTDVN
ncbi:MAG: DUF5689 domain-containing protein [Chitinophagales bacterium]